MDVKLLQQALAAVARRHELLRASFSDTDGKLMQSIGVAGSQLQCRPLDRDVSLQTLVQVDNTFCGGICCMSIHGQNEASEESSVQSSDRLQILASLLILT